MSGAGSEVSRGEQRKQLLNERDERIIKFMHEQLPVANIAELEGLEEDYTRKATRRLAVEHDIDYKPVKNQNGAGLLTEATRYFRNNIANRLYALRNKPGQHPLAVARDTGLTQAQQVAASERGGLHDYKLSQLERIAAMSGDDFKLMMLKALLTPDEYQKVARCLTN